MSPRTTIAAFQVSQALALVNTTPLIPLGFNEASCSTFVTCVLRTPREWTLSVSGLCGVRRERMACSYLSCGLLSSLVGFSGASSGVRKRRTQTLGGIVDDYIESIVVVAEQE